MKRKEVIDNLLSCLFSMAIVLVSFIISITIGYLWAQIC